MASAARSPEAETTPSKSPRSKSEFDITSSNLPQAVVLWDPNVSRNPPTLSELLCSESVVLSVGPEQTKTTIHRIVFRGISEPLHQMLNSHSYGHVSNINEALKFDDTDAFLQLVRIAYQNASSAKNTFNSGLKLEAVNFEDSSQRSYDPHAGDGYANPENIKTPRCETCNGGRLSLTTACQACKRRPNTLRPNNSHPLKEFMHAVFNQNINVKSRQTVSAEHNLAVKDPNGQPRTLLNIARIYALARKYQVLELEYSSLRAFERRLRRFSKQSEADRDDEEILGVLRYIAEEFVGDVDEVNPICRCLMRYVVLRMEEFLDDDEFKEIILSNALFGLELALVFRELCVAADE